MSSTKLFADDLKIYRSLHDPAYEFWKGMWMRSPIGRTGSKMFAVEDVICFLLTFDVKIFRRIGGDVISTTDDFEILLLQSTPNFNWACGVLLLLTFLQNKLYYPSFPTQMYSALSKWIHRILPTRFGRPGSSYVVPLFAFWCQVARACPETLHLPRFSQGLPWSIPAKLHYQA